MRRGAANYGAAYYYGVSYHIFYGARIYQGEDPVRARDPPDEPGSTTIDHYDSSR